MGVKEKFATDRFLILDVNYFWTNSLLNMGAAQNCPDFGAMVDTTTAPSSFRIAAAAIGPGEIIREPAPVLRLLRRRFGTRLAYRQLPVRTRRDSRPAFECKIEGRR